MEGKCRLAWQKGATAIFAEASVNVQQLSNDEWSIKMPANINSIWAIGVRFGVEMFRECLRINEQLASGFRIRINQFIGQSVDTTLVSVAYVTFHALGNAMRTDTGRIFKFDESSGSFVVNLPETAID